MKKYFVVAAAMLCVSTSCVRRQAVLEMAGQRDSLSMVVGQKDSLLEVVFEDINAILGNLSEIKMRENLITVPEDAEGGIRPVQQINSDIAAIDRLLQENRTKIASLENAAKQLRRANVKIEALEKTIVNLSDRLAEKTAEVEELRDRLAEREAQLARLETQVAEQDIELKMLNGENIRLENRLNTVYYIVGEEKELLDAQIINKEGFIGRTLTVGRNGALGSFTETDSRLLSEVPVGKKRATVVTSHPDGSYKLVMGEDKRVESLVIIDPARFWESSRLLIISYK
ncbi:MAG: hypothetical protein K2L09_05455 [Alistipes sp.]|nr:hypothetical protein [Alistipes sp.]